MIDFGKSDQNSVAQWECLIMSPNQWQNVTCHTHYSWCCTSIKSPPYKRDPISSWAAAHPGWYFYQSKTLKICCHVWAIGYSLLFRYTLLGHRKLRLNPLEIKDEGLWESLRVDMTELRASGSWFQFLRALVVSQIWVTFTLHRHGVSWLTTQLQHGLAGWSIVED